MIEKQNNVACAKCKHFEQRYDTEPFIVRCNNPICWTPNPVIVNDPIHGPKREVIRIADYHTLNSLNACRYFEQKDAD